MIILGKLSSSRNQVEKRNQDECSVHLLSIKKSSENVNQLNMYFKLKITNVKITNESV